jgi:hypothetical protein
MKYLIFTAVISFCLFIASCSESKKEILPPPHKPSAYRVLLFSKTNTDTTISTTMWARTETVGLVTVEDSKLKAELISYNGHGVYTVKVTSKVECQGIVRWGWDGLTIDSISPNSDVIQAGQSVTFTLHGDHKEGRIKLKLESPCGNSSTLIINITTAILPVKIIETIGTYDEKSKKTIITFTIDDPMLFDWILVQRLNGEKVWVQAMLIASDKTTKSYSIKL